MSLCAITSGRQPDARLRIDCVVGTRPDAIKMAPVVHALSADGAFAPRVICTGQHRELIEDLLPLLGLRPEVDLALQAASDALSDKLGLAISRLAALWREQRPAAVLVQGDTTTALAAGLAAHYERISLGHVEAGLRSFDRLQPFPEETNRVLISHVADWHFCPTAPNRQFLVREGIDERRTYLTGNTGIDSFLRFWNDDCDPVVVDLDARRTLLVTAHRRENWNGPFEEICEALAQIAREIPDVQIIFPVHGNPLLRTAAHERLAGAPGVRLIDPLRYDRFVRLMKRAALLVTDSGGIQEEACTVGKPTLLLRNVTERQEAASGGSVRIVGTARDAVVAAACELLSRPTELAALSRPTNCFGDGRAAQRIVAALRHELLLETRPDDYCCEDLAAKRGSDCSQRR